MKKIIILYTIFISICLLLPIFFIERFVTTTVQEKIEKVTEESTAYDYGKYNTIKLLYADRNEIKEVELDTYLYGVVAAEMPASYNEEALKAQAVVARTYTIYKILNGSKHEGANICTDSSCCQAWISKEKRFERWEDSEKESNWNKITEAVNSTQGKIITYEGAPINAFFHANSGGKTETVEKVWGGTNYPYLQVIETSGEENYSQYSSEVIISKEELTNQIKEYHSDFEINFEEENPIQIVEYTESGRVAKVKVGNLNLSGVEIRTIFKLKSANFIIKIEGENVKFAVTGYGHGVGLSQTGADSLGKSGYNYEEIIKHFYVGVEVSTL